MITNSSYVIGTQETAEFFKVRAYDEHGWLPHKRQML